MKTKKSILYGWISLITAGALAVTAAGVASATEIPYTNSSLQDVSKDIETAIETQPDVFLDTPLIDEGKVKIDEGVITAPSASMEEFSLTLPANSLNKFRTPSTSEYGDYSIEVHDEGDGAFRSLFHIPNSSSPKEYSIEIDSNYLLTYLEDGGIAVWDQEDNLVGTFTPPWAVDAKGSNVNTDYIIDGNRLIQRVHTDAATIYPVVADPFWIPALGVMAHFTRHALTQMAARSVSKELVKQVVRNGAKTAGKKGTSVFTQGKGKNRIRVIVANKTGNIITVTKG